MKRNTRKNKQISFRLAILSAQAQVTVLWGLIRWSGGPKACECLHIGTLVHEQTNVVKPVIEDYGQLEWRGSELVL